MIGLGISSIRLGTHLTSPTTASPPPTACSRSMSAPAQKPRPAPATALGRRGRSTPVGAGGGVGGGPPRRGPPARGGGGRGGPARSERVARRPARPVYSIPGEAARELRTLRERALTDPQKPPADPVGV